MINQAGLTMQGMAQGSWSGAEFQSAPRQQAIWLYQRASSRGWWKCLFGRKWLACAEVRATGGRDMGIRPVELTRITGSEGRSRDFDRDFRPMASHLRDRWVSVAEAWLKGVVLPPIELIAVGQHFVVRDGHHRISVARALGLTVLEAHVTVCQE